MRLVKKTVLIVDEAQALSPQALETLRLFGNLETEQDKLIQLVLFGQPELDERLASHELRQFRQRITFSCQLRPLSIDEGVAYINNRLDKAGNGAHIFSIEQKKAIWRSSMGIPRLINQISHKSLLAAFNDRCTLLKNHHAFCQGSFVMQMRNSYICAVSKILDDMRNPAGLMLTYYHYLAL